MIYRDSPRTNLHTSKLLPLILSSEITVNKIECDYYPVSYNELNRRLRHWRNILYSYIFDVDNVKYIVDFNKSYLYINDILIKHDVAVKHILHRNQYYRNKPILVNYININLFERFNRPCESNNKRFGLYSYNDQALELYDNNKNNDIIGKFIHIFHKHTQDNPEIYIYGFHYDDKLNYDQIKVLLPDSFQMFECVDGSLYFIKKIIINDRYCF